MRESRIGKSPQARRGDIERHRVDGFLFEQVAGDQHEVHAVLNRIIDHAGIGAGEVNGALGVPVLLLAEMEVCHVNESGFGHSRIHFTSPVVTRRRKHAAASVVEGPIQNPSTSQGGISGPAANSS